MKSQLIAYLLREVNMYIEIWAFKMKCTQYGICGQVAFKNAKGNLI